MKCSTYHIPNEFNECINKILTDLLTSRFDNLKHIFTYIFTCKMYSTYMIAANILGNLSHRDKECVLEYNQGEVCKKVKLCQFINKQKQFITSKIRERRIVNL